ncbi:FecR family protein [Pedobacter sp.]|uniref:FecR family protein n=1 Tax=Pedobacter sp. TaxID=1411316 RepID=UPI003BAB75E8
MLKYDINDLLKKFREGTILPEEQDYLEAWYLNWQPENQHISQTEIQDAKERVWSSLAKPITHKLKPWYWLSAIAGVFLVLCLFWFFKTDSNTVNSNLVAKRPKIDFNPGSNKAVLTLAGGEEISLSDDKKGNIAKQGATEISRTESGKLIYSGKLTDKQAALMMNKVSTPRGGEYQLILSDGTKVWLNAASSITFPAAFTGNQRLVTVTGEAYFEVAHDKKKPFIVSAGDQQISVLGTHFNVSAYDDDDFTKTSLISGLVNVKNLKSGQIKQIRPGQAASSSAKIYDLQIHPIDIDEILSWKNGYFQFDNQSIHSIMKIMSRWYNVDVEYSSDKNIERFGGTFSRGKQLSETLANLEKLGNVHFRITPKKVIVSN